MEEPRLQLFIAMFGNQSGAEEGASAVHEIRKGNKDAIQAAVAIIKDEHSGIHYKDIGLTPTKGALGGAALGAALGILTGGVGLALGALGALMGGLIGGKKRGESFSEVRLNEIVGSLKPGTSALVVVAEGEYLSELETAFSESQAETFTAPISADLAEQLRQHRDHDWVEKLDR